MSRQEYLPTHPNANIHGVVGKNRETTCSTANGKMCTGCCTGLRLEKPGVVKVEGSNCDGQVIGAGCVFIIKGTPEKRFPACSPYHCSADLRKAEHGDLTARQRLFLENASALTNHEIDQETFRSNLERIP